MVFLEEENAIAEWEMGSQRKENDRRVMKERTEGDRREAEEGPGVCRRSGTREQKPWDTTGRGDARAQLRPGISDLTQAFTSPILKSF